MTAYRAAFAGVVLLLSAPALVHSQGARSTDQGLTLGIAYTGAAMSTTEDGTTTSESGNGVVAEAGYSLGKLWLGGQFNSARMNASDGAGTYTLSGFGFTGRYAFRGIDKMARPYLEAGALRRQITTDFVERQATTTVKASSMGASFGGGVAVHLSPRSALDIGGQYGFGSFTDWKANGVAFPMPDWKATTFVLRVGGRWWLAAK